MKIHEYQAKQIFRRFDMPIPEDRVATTPEEVKQAAKQLGGGLTVVKAQVLVGGRGKAGGVKLAENPNDAREKAETILGMDLKGLTVRKVLVTPAVDIRDEYYLGIVQDRAAQAPTLMVSAAGGVDIEEVARTSPEKIVKYRIDPVRGLRAFEARKVAFQIADGRVAIRIADMIRRLWLAYDSVDASLAEINPLVVTPEDKVWAIDAKINLDDNGLFRQGDIAEWRDPDESEPEENEAREAGLSFVKLEGNVGCVVNGAGLAMATMDLVKYYGGEPANFLDVGGSSNPDKVVKALDIITRDSNVKCILFNIFGGITRCDDIARGIIEAKRRIDISVPVVVRLIGTNEEEGRALLAETDLVPAETMDEAVQKSIELAGGAA
ncbi:MAG: ADP-forming succinate--CoA ligase subunit beta [Candidatus Krumholzibacteria bacterium]|nr:ADP-forming succinate--CoA ligase subunit beta [Candidatus Krumholzibacteria bacterium]MDP6669540.1 ADP-forming succinate--CoA ligase subunit beta [Candidatus Krumholzibacteria bacterium]MDP6797644.1 ADP-forming succinate--CoA ligase subunit beta [Candidatus Krumholzibacteria bacterium]MDP7020764.1 ADP-forming succinate--CoA ligase subunit beta [Candidatus Krumholzibacteria bacterium]